ncbi:Rha family transcriptional regulator [Ligilactobacillus cholophilus]|uniref:Rha family transcriptional regulator n=1 Tax=Ligilactobacillus cholophilus TaxID=3050131 RepID=UPI0025AF2F12|nr:Rha family transcriptional regulator [Ligilactobacillus cholophilus]
MKELVFKTTALSTAEPYTTSEVIAEYSENEHKSIRKLIETHKTTLERLGVLTFEIAKPPKNSKGGRPRKIYHLNEQQATFLITLLKNTPNVVAFKFELTRQFYATRNELKKRHSLRLEDKSKRKTLTDAVKEWNLKENYPHPYSMFTNLLCKVTTGKSCKQFKASCKADKKTPITELMNVNQLEKYQGLENKIIALLSLNMDYQQIKAYLNGGTLQVTI